VQCNVGISFDFETSINHWRTTQKIDFEMIDCISRVYNFFMRFFLGFGFYFEGVLTFQVNQKIGCPTLFDALSSEYTAYSIRQNCGDPRWAYAIRQT